MKEYDTHGSLQLLVGELLYKNQLLREAVASKDQAIDLIIGHLMTATVLACSCGAGSRSELIRNAVTSRNLDFARRRNSCFGEFGDVTPRAANNVGTDAGAEITPVEVGDCDFCSL
jgi:hypothetical protein